MGGVGVDGRIRAIDLARGGAAPPIAVGANPSAIAAGAGALWVASEEAGTVTRIAPRTGSVVETITVGHGPSALAVGEGGVWVVNRHEGRSRVSTRPRTRRWTVHIGGDPTAVAVGGGGVWVAGGEEGVVTRVDPDAPRDIETLKTGNRPAAIAVADGSVWAAADAPRAAHRGGTLRVLVPDVPDALPIDRSTTAHERRTLPAQLADLRRPGGVPAPRGRRRRDARRRTRHDAPGPSPDGRTYVFTLRPRVAVLRRGPVRPEDFRASMERFLQVTQATVPAALCGDRRGRRCSAKRPAATSPGGSRPMHRRARSPST